MMNCLLALLSVVLGLSFTPAGDYIVSVTASGMTREEAIENARLTAVRTVLLEGIEANPEVRFPHQGSIANSVNLREGGREGIESFLADRKGIAGFVSLFPGDLPRFVKLKKGFRATVRLVVAKVALRREMENRGYIKPLNNQLP
jgi:hypothetical protein